MLGPKLDPDFRRFAGGPRDIGIVASVLMTMRATIPIGSILRARGCQLVLASFLALQVALGAGAREAWANELADKAAVEVPGVSRLTYENGKLSLTAEKSEVLPLLTRISALTKVPIEINYILVSKATLAFKDLTVEEGVAKILEAAGERNLIAEYAKSGEQAKGELQVDKIVILRKGKPRTKEDADPATSPQSKMQIVDFLRLTSVGKDDKPILKAALEDPQYEKIRDHLELAMLHGILDHPEESDKEFVLGLLKAMRLGWVIYAMPKVWDDRYIGRPG